MSTPEIAVNPCVSSHGYSSANIFFLSGHPLAEDIKQGVALSGHNESTLNQFLKPVKLDIKQCYRSVFIKEKLEYSGTNTKKLKNALAKVNIPYYEKLLFEEIKSVLPNIIVPLDDIALSHVFPHINAIKKPKGRKYWTYCYRGSILPLRDDWQKEIGSESIIRVIPTLSPQILYNDWTARSYVRLDYNRIAANAIRRSPIEEYGLIWVARSVVEFDNFLERMRAKHPKRVTFDIETYGGLMTCISFCFDGFEAVSVPLYDFTIPAGERAILWQRVAKILASDLEKNNQNIKYDWIILERHGFFVNNVKSDTMLKGALLYPELPKGLDFYTSIYTPISYYKDEGKEFNPKLHSKDRLYLYNAKDSLAAHIVSDEQDKELDEAENNETDTSGQFLKKLYHEEIAPSILIYRNLDETGIKVDPLVKGKLRRKYDDHYGSNLSIVRGMVGKDTFNPRSSQQVGELIYEELGFPKRTKTDPETGKTSYKTDKETLDDLLINHGDQTKSGKIGYAIISRVIVCRKLAKVIEYIETPLHSDGRLKGSSNLAGTETGRSSFSKTIDERFRIESDSKSTKATKRLGRSLQTISKHGFKIDDEIFDDFEDAEIAADLRSMFVPSRGYVFIEGDGNGAEARAVFVLAEDYEGLAAMDQKPKIHAKTAAAVFGIDVNTITKDSPKVPKIGIAYYDLGKRVRHAGNYNMGPGRLCQMTHLPFAFCKQALDKFHEKDPKLRGVFHEQVKEFLKLRRYLVTPFGRKRDFFARWDDSLIKEGLAYIPQSTISDLTKFTMHRIVSSMDGYLTTYRFLTEQHDGILAEVKKDDAMKFAEVFKKCYERPVNFNNCSLPRDFQLIIPAEISYSDSNWMNLKEIHVD